VLAECMNDSHWRFKESNPGKSPLESSLISKASKVERSREQGATKGRDQASPLTPDDTNRSEITLPMQKGSFEEGKIS